MHDAIPLACHLTPITLIRNTETEQEVLGVVSKDSAVLHAACHLYTCAMGQASILAAQMEKHQESEKAQVPPSSLDVLVFICVLVLVLL